MTDLLSLLCEAAGGIDDDLEDPRQAKKRKTTALPSVSPLSSLFSASNPSSNDSFQRVRSPSMNLYSSTPFSRSPLQQSLLSLVEDREASNGPHSPTGSVDSSSVTSAMDESSPDDASSEDEGQESQINLKKRKRVTKHQSRRAKPLTVEILAQIFETLAIFKDSATGTYKLMLPLLKSAECSSKYFAVTEWQCFRKRIMNHGFEIVDEQQAVWIRVRPNLATAEGVLVFEDAELRKRFGTPCKIKNARERGEIFELPASEMPLEYDFISDSDDHSSAASSDATVSAPGSPSSSSSSSSSSSNAMDLTQHHSPASSHSGPSSPMPSSPFFASQAASSAHSHGLAPVPFLPAFAALRAEIEQDLDAFSHASASSSAATTPTSHASHEHSHASGANSAVVTSEIPASNVQLEGALRNCLPLSLVVRELLNSGHYSLSNGQFDIQVTMKQQLTALARPVVAASSQQSLFPRFSAGLKSEPSDSAAKLPLA